MIPSERREMPRSVPEEATPDGPHAALDGDLSVVVGSLHEKYDDQVGPAVVDTEIRRVADRFTDVPIRSFVPLFVRRYAGATLRRHSAATAQPR